MRTIALSIDGHGVSIPVFIRAIQTAKKFPNAKFPRSIKCWWAKTGNEIINEYHEIINDTINKRGGIVLKEIDTAYYHAQRLLNSNCIVREHDLPLKLRARFADRIYRE